MMSEAGIFRPEKRRAGNRLSMRHACRVVTGVCGAFIVLNCSCAGQKVPEIVSHPRDQRVAAGCAATFSVRATGVALRFQWLKGTDTLSGATSAAYTIQAACAEDNGAAYRCVVGNAAGSVTSKTATLTVEPDSTGGALPEFDLPVTDIDGNVYRTVKLGKQVWSAENARTGTFNDGSPVPLVTGIEEWEKLDGPGYCFCDNTTDPEEREQYGALYNWHAVNSGRLAPPGWRVPTEEDWRVLENHLISSGFNWDNTTSGNKTGKSLAAPSGWVPHNVAGNPGNDSAGNNRTGFSALAGGYRRYDGQFYSRNYYGYWWSATEHDGPFAWYVRLFYDRSGLYRLVSNQRYGFSVRFIRE